MVCPKVLLIEDSPTYAELATILLEASGCTVIRASTADLGLQLAREEAPDLVLMDIHLPGMDGFRAVRSLREDPRTSGIPAVGLTADRIGTDEERERAREAGFDAYVTKPINRSGFHAIVAPFLDPRDEAP